jgi:rare lipoprotein A
MNAEGMMRGGTALRLVCGMIVGTGLVVTTYGVGDRENHSSGNSAEAALVVAHEPDRLLPQVGVASWYGFDHQGKLTASGKRFDARKLTAAHPTLPLNSKAKVTNLDNGRTVEVVINDRGPGAPGRAIDLSERAAKTIGMKKDGLAPVIIQPVEPKTSEVASR